MAARISPKENAMCHHTMGDPGYEEGVATVSSLFRTGNVSSLGLQPTWIPFSSTLMHGRRLDFALDVYDSEWCCIQGDLGSLLGIPPSLWLNDREPTSQACLQGMS